MKNLLSPKWIFVINTLPVLILFFIYAGVFRIIESLLEERNIRFWLIFGGVLAILSLINFLYALYLHGKKQNVTVQNALFSLFAYITFLYMYGVYSNDIIPFSIPNWMVPENIIIYVFTFLMPTLAYSLFVLLIHFTSDAKEPKAWKSFLAAIAVPVLWYVYVEIILPLRRPLSGKFNEHVFLILAIISVLIFLFFLIRTIFILLTKKSAILQKYQLLWKIPLALIFPVAGLWLNDGFYGGQIFGDLSSLWFYILAVINGILICLPDIDNKRYRLFLFTGRSITFAYTFYFFLVFLPFLPISVIAILAIGAGFLMLTPLLLFVIHVDELSSDFEYLKNYFQNKKLLAILIGGFLLIPLTITAVYLKDKNVLKKTLSYVYAPDYSRNYEIDENSLKKTLKHIKRSKDNHGRGFFYAQTPYLSSYFNWLVLDNLTLSDKKIGKIENIFFGESTFYEYDWSENTGNDSVHIENIEVESNYDKQKQQWTSWVNFEINNQANNSRFAEYASSFELPAGCWISDYYLYLGEKKEMGILAEKKSAMWVFSQIRNTNKDPGILYYLTGNKVAFKVFPFSANETRKTGIQFVHKETVQLTIDGYHIILGDSLHSNNQPVETLNSIYLPAQQKQHLKHIRRTPYFHFIVDISENAGENISILIKQIEQIIAQNKALAENARISYVNSYVLDGKFNSDWKQNLRAQKFEGGLFLDRAIRQVLIRSYYENSASYPVIVVITNSFGHAVLGKDFSDLEITYPDNSIFLLAKENNQPEFHSLKENAHLKLSDTVIYSFNNQIVEYSFENNRTAYLPDNNKASIILKNENFNIDEKEIKEKDWKSGLIMEAMQMTHDLHPELAEKEWLKLVKYSFISKIMNYLSSYIVVENEAQKAILKKKQAQILAGNKSLDPDEDTLRMSEPNIFILLVLFGFALFIIKKRRNAKFL